MSCPGAPKDVAGAEDEGDARKEQRHVDSEEQQEADPAGPPAVLLLEPAEDVAEDAHALHVTEAAVLMGVPLPSKPSAEAGSEQLRVSPKMLAPCTVRQRC